MNPIIEKIHALDQLIDEYVPYFLSPQEEDYMNLIQPLLQGLEELLPMVVESYDSPSMEDLREDQAYWPAQLERIIGALSSGDRFLIIDSLKYELMGNLKELVKEYEKRGMAE